jgi:hypothetical protein
LITAFRFGGPSVNQTTTGAITRWSTSTARSTSASVLNLLNENRMFAPVRPGYPLLLPLLQALPPAARDALNVEVVDEHLALAVFRQMQR